MVDVNEPTRLDRKLQRRWEQLAEADIDDRDREAIRRFVEHRRDVEDRARSTLTNDLSQLRCASERAETALVDMAFTDARRLLSTLVTPEAEGGYGLDPDGTGFFGYKRALRIFFRWLHTHDEFGAYPFHDDIELPDLEMSGATGRDEMLSGAEIEALKDAARSARDRALIALLADIGGRIGMLLSLRVKDIHLDGERPYLEPNDAVSDGLKNLSSSQIPILHSRADLRTYYHKHHPAPDRPDAPFWAVQKGWDPDEIASNALGYDRARDILAECAHRAGVDKPVNPHNFRRTAATRMSNSDRLTPQEIMQITGWADDRPLDAYDQTTEAERNAAIHNTLGFADATTVEDAADLALEHRPCGNCNEQVPTDARFCANCGEPLTEEARASAADASDSVTDDAITTNDPERRELKAVIREAIVEDPSLIEDALHD